MFLCAKSDCSERVLGLQSTLFGWALIALVNRVNQERSRLNRQLSRFNRIFGARFWRAANTCKHDSAFFFEQTDHAIPFACINEDCRRDFIVRAALGPQGHFWRFTLETLAKFERAYAERIAQVLGNVPIMNIGYRVHYTYSRVNGPEDPWRTESFEIYNGTLTGLWQHMLDIECFDFALGEVPAGVYNCLFHREEPAEEE